MRISITLSGKATTISVDDTLMDYLGATMVKNSPRLHTNAKRQQEMAKEFIRDVILQLPDVPNRDVSQYVQRKIICAVAADGLDAIIDTRGPRYKKEPANLARLFGGDAQAAARAVEQAKSKLTPLASSGSKS